MSLLSLSKPLAGDTDWTDEINQNWTDLQGAINALGFSAGRVAFSDGTTLIGSSSLFWDNANGRLGVGTANPGQRLSLADDSILEIGVSGDGSFAAGLKVWRTTGSPTLGYEFGFIYCVNDGAVTADQETLRIHGRNILFETGGVLPAVSIDSSQNISLGASGTSIGFLGATPAARQISGANLTNSVTSGGTNDTIANFTDLTTYANDAAAIRNDIYQLARKVKQLNDAFRLYGLLS